MSSGTRPAEVQFEKVLWRKQPFADNFVPATFLSDLRTNSQVVLLSRRQVMIASLRISSRFLCVCLFALLFVHLHLRTVDAEVLLGFSMAIFGLVKLLHCSGDRQRASSHRKALGSVVSKIIMALVLMAVSPVLRTLTESTTSDTIWALAVLLFALHLTLADYSGVKGQQLSSSLSFNAAISASVVLASRLQTDRETFTLLVLAVVMFAPTSGRESHAGVAEFVSVYVLCMVVVGLFHWLQRGGWEVTVVVWINVVVSFVSVACPWWIVHAQRWKMEIKGPWDPAEPKLRPLS